MENALAAVTAAQSARKQQAEAVSVTLAQMKSHLLMREEQRCVPGSDVCPEDRHGISKFRREHVGKVVSPRGVRMEQARDAERDRLRERGAGREKERETALQTQARKIAEQEKLLGELTAANAQLRQGLEAAHTLIHRQRSVE